MGRAVDSKQIKVSVSKEIENYLEELARIGVQGKTAAEVARTFINNEVERLILQGFIQQKNKESEK